jgi:phosphomannomutase/phosphoglucomutase
MLFATDIISRSPGSDVIFDVKSTRHLNSCITNAGGRPVMWKTGHSMMRQKMQETGAVVGAEYSGHIFIRDRWFGFDDGHYAAARLLEVLTLQDESLDQAFEAFPVSIATPEYRVSISESDKFDFVEKLKSQADFGEGKLTTIDGVRVDYGYGWGLVRASNTGPELTLRFEADTEENIHQLKSLFVQELRKIDNTIEVSWDQDAG